MTAKTRAVEHVDATPQPAPAPTHLGQATAIEQSRAVAEVHAAIVVAQQCPRSLQAALNAMRESCAQKGLAERAFYRYPRGNGTVTGESVHLARELARCWGNIQYGIAELRRDDEGGYSEIQAFAWDVEPLVQLRDIYENNANNGARRLRQAIFSVLPPWFIEEAKDICSKTLADGGGKSRAQRIADAIKSFEGLGVTADQVEQKLGRERDRWTDHDLAQLAVTFRSLQRGEVTRDEEFPPPRVTADEIAGPAPAPVEGDESWPEAARPGGVR
jgi:hypothetical protein